MYSEFIKINGLDLMNVCLRLEKNFRGEFEKFIDGVNFDCSKECICDLYLYRHTNYVIYSSTSKTSM